MAKRKDINIFDKGRKVANSGRVSDMDYLDAFEENLPGRDIKKVESKPDVARSSSNVKKNKEWVRHTFIIKPENLEDLKDIVHTVKSTGEYQYSQKQALDDAIKLLKMKIEKTVGEIKKFKG
ncbi:MAG: hypothetical protein AAGI07_15670 [Bacteroidota bacterium]